MFWPLLMLICNILVVVATYERIRATSGQSYKASMIIIYDSRVIPDLKIPHTTTLDS